MRTSIFLAEVPADELLVIREGYHTVIFFDIVAKTDGIENEYVCEVVHVDGFEKKDIISAIITERYDNDDTQAILANYTDALHDTSLTDEKRNEYIAEYAAYQDYRELAKEVTDKVISIINGNN